jgi:predicted nucleotidyltransferase
MKRKIKPGQFKELTSFFSEKNEILTVYLFGSYGTELESEHSDLDLGILFSTPLSLMEELALAAEIEKIIECEVDLVSLNKVNILLKYKIIKTGSKIYESIPLCTAEFIESVLREYFDFGVKLKMLKADFHNSLREDYL